MSHNIGENVVEDLKRFPHMRLTFLYLYERLVQMIESGQATVKSHDSKFVGMEIAEVHQIMHCEGVMYYEECRRYIAIGEVLGVFRILVETSRQGSHKHLRIMHQQALISEGENTAWSDLDHFSFKLAIDLGSVNARYGFSLFEGEDDQ